jgi:hypothetical protein
MIRQRSHIGFTDARTFIASSRQRIQSFERTPTNPMNRVGGHQKTGPKAEKEG